MGRRAIIGLLGLTALVLLAFGAERVARDTPPPRKAATGATGPTGPTPERAASSPARAPVEVPAAVRAQAEGMPRERQVAQLFLVGFEGNDATASIFTELRTRGWGGVLLGADNVLSADQVAFLAGEAAAVSEIPPLVAAIDVPDVLPPPQFSSDSPVEARDAARTAAARFRAEGVNLVFAPVADVGLQEEEGTFGDDPEQVARRASAAVRGWLAGGVIAAPGHFPGQGAATQDPLEGPSMVGLSAEELAARDLIPFRALLRAPAIVVSSASFSAYDPVTPAALTPQIVGDLLRGELGYTGVAISDDLSGAAAATAGTVAEAAVEAIRAGIDMLQIPDPGERELAYRAVLAAVREGRIPPARLREALLRVLSLKRGLG